MDRVEVEGVGPSLLIEGRGYEFHLLGPFAKAVAHVRPLLDEDDFGVLEAERASELDRGSDDGTSGSHHNDIIVGCFCKGLH